MSLCGCHSGILECSEQLIEPSGLSDDVLIDLADNRKPRLTDPEVDRGGRATLITLHSAKGLEFPVVFMIAMEEGVLPHVRSFDDQGQMEEERRLCYVGMTRAMQELVLTYAEQRRLHGTDSFGQVSRFVNEVPEELIEEVRPRIQISRPVHFSRNGRLVEESDSGMRLGQRVRHGKFGEGVVMNIEGQGANARIWVNFETLGTKCLMAGYAKLEPM